MISARDLFVQGFGRGIIHPGDLEALKSLTQAADLWRTSGNHFYAGYAMTEAIHAAWGDGERVNACLNAALLDYRNCVTTQPPESHESLAAIHMWASQLRYIDDRTYARRMVEGLQQELAQRLIRFFNNSPHVDSYFVKGIVVSTDLEGLWEPSYPEQEVNFSIITFVPGHVSISLPSAFMLFIGLNDFQGAESVIQCCPNAFQNPGLRGWRAAVQGFLRPDDAESKFTEAGDAFAEDVAPSKEELIARGGSWSGINVQLWSKYFYARADLAHIIREPNRTKELIKSASKALEGTESGFVNPQVSRFRILVHALAELVSEEPAISLEKARQELESELRAFGEVNDDPLSLQFLTTVAQAFEEFRTNPKQALTTGRLRDALDILGRISLIGTDVAKAVEPAIGASAFAETLGPVRTWVYRTLGSITDEAQFRKVILRLAQASLPLYGQIRHGPIEYGKDIAVVLEKDGEIVLRMYQAKCGDITASSWRDIRNELEEMFLVPLAALQVHRSVDSREGVLICNGHANIYAEPVIQGWFQEQKQDHDHEFRFMHLDDIVNWIIDDRLINEFKAALNELGIKIMAGSDL